MGNRFKSFSAKIALGYIILLVVSFLVVGFSFHGLVTKFLVRDAQDSLLREGEAMMEAAALQPPGNAGMGMGPRGSHGHGPGHGGRRRLVLGTRLVQGDYIFTDLDLNIMDSSRPDLFPINSTVTGPIGDVLLKERLTPGSGLRFSTGDFVAVALPAAGAGSEVSGILILLAAVDIVEGISWEIARLLLIILAAASLLGILLALALGRSISRPLGFLKKKARDMASRDFSHKVDIRTGDEMEELGEAFDLMREKLMEYDAAQRRFLQNASHELKTPLMSIQGYAEAVKDGVVDGEEEVDRSMDVVIRESQRLKDMVEDIIFLSKLENFEEQYDYNEVEIEELLHEAVESVQGFAGDRGITLRFSPDTMTSLYCDGEKMLRVFVNILGNAVNHASDEVAISVEQAGDGCKVIFQDDGEGFTEKDLDRLFDRFYKGSGGGSGLGMAIARTIVGNHGGGITADNTDMGARVVVLLPGGVKMKGQI
ncbi:MAG: HAMP domain-containing histidine kinase [Clostridia bacterium]|nr:HAMP domain-containing histidine kinase [Clostridia bacterium]